MKHKSYPPRSLRLSAVLRPSFAVQGLCLLLAAVSPTTPNAAAAEQASIDFVKQVLPILESRCFSCHSTKKIKGQLRLDHPDFIKKGGEDGPVIVAGRPTDSLLFKRISLPDDDDYLMPANARRTERLSSEQTSILGQWIAQGASYGSWQPIPDDKPVVPPMVAGWKTIVVKSYTIPIPDGWRAASSAEIKSYNAFLAQIGQHVTMDGRLVQQGADLVGPLGINICVVPRAIFEPELADIVKHQAEIIREVDAAQPLLHHMKSEGAYFDAKRQMLVSQTKSIRADGTPLAYNGIILFRNSLQVEVHGNSLLADKDKMAGLVGLIASGIARAP